MGYEISEINNFTEFIALEKEWNVLLSQSANDIPFLRHEWFRLWWSSFGQHRSMAVIVARKQDRLVLVMPLMETRYFWWGIPFVALQSMTNYHSFRYHILLQIGEEAAVLQAWQYLRHRPRHWDLLQLEEWPADITAYKLLLEDARRDDHSVGIWSDYQSPYLSIQGNWETYRQTLKPKFRSNMRNRTKRLQQQGRIEHEVISNPADIQGSLAEGFAIEQKSWKGGKGSAIACNPLLVDFYTRWAETAARERWLMLSFLKVNGKRVAFDYSLAYQNRVYCMKIGYDPAFSPYSVGQLLCERMLQRCFEDGIIEYDFLGESSTQKSDWTAFSRKHLRLFVYNRTVPSRLHHIYNFVIKQKLKEWSGRAK